MLAIFRVNNIERKYNETKIYSIDVFVSLTINILYSYGNGENVDYTCK